MKALIRLACAMFASFQSFVAPESFSLMESVMIVAMVVLGGLGHLPGVILGAVLLSFVPEVLRYTVEPMQRALFGRMLIEPEVSSTFRPITFTGSGPL